MKEQEEQNTPTVTPKKKSRAGTAVLILIGILILIGLFGNKPQETTNNNGDTPTATIETDASAASKNEETKPRQPDVPAEYTSALAQATTYSNTMHMSKQGVYDQLTSEYGGQFTSKAAQYAIDNVEANWKENALQSAKSYQENMHMSPAAIHDQLTSSYGGQFTKAEADYAIKHLND